MSTPREKLITKILTVNELKQIATEVFLNHTDSVTKISPDSVLNAMLFTQAKLAQKGIKEVAINESRIFPELSNGSYLDDSADLFGVPDRLLESGSSAFVTLIADPQTRYISGVHKFTAKSGIEFELTESVTIDANGFGYGKIRSLQSGDQTNVDANTITTLTPSLIGHIACSNEYAAIGGRNIESDESFKIRIKNRPNLLARKTTDYLLEIMREIDTDILRVFNLGVSTVNGHNRISVVKENGSDLTLPEIQQIKNYIKDFVAITDTDIQGNIIGLDIENVNWEYVDMDFRVQLLPNFSSETVRKNIQLQINKYLDFRYWETTRKVEWDDLLQIVKNTEGIGYVPDNFFNPSVDKSLQFGSLPRVRGFIMKDLSGNILFNNSDSVLSVFYQSLA